MPAQTGPNAVIIETANLHWNESDEPVSDLFGDRYFSASGGLSESRYVFLDHNDLPHRLAQVKENQTFTIAETGFGTGLNFLATAELWTSLESTSLEAMGWLHFVSFERYPLTRRDLERALERWPELQRQAQLLLARYPEPIRGAHRLVWPEYRIRLTLWYGDALDGLESLPFLADAWFLDGFNPSTNAELWNESLYQAIARHSCSGTTLATYSAAGAVRRGLSAAGFIVEKVPGHWPKRDMTRGVLQRTGASQHTGNTAPKRVIVVGAGIAGCLVAENLARRGSEVLLMDAGMAPGAEASGNPQGALYVKLGVDYSPQSQLALACLAFAQRFYASRQAEAAENREAERFWYPTGLLQLATTEAEIDRQQRFLARHNYPEGIFRPISPEQATALAGMQVMHSGLYFPRSGWLSPQALCRALVSHRNITFRGQTRLVGFGIESENHWVETDSMERLECDQLVLCTGASDLLKALELPVKPIRGQVSWWPDSALTAPDCVICGEGYINPSDGRIVTVGATFDLHDDSSAVRSADNEKNLETVGRWLPALTRTEPAAIDATGRTSFRATTPDYQPLAGILFPLGQLPDTTRALVTQAPERTAKAEGRTEGIAVLSGLGSKGLSFAPLLAEWLCDAVCQGVPALPVDLAELVHPQRFHIRRARRGSEQQGIKKQ